MEPGQARAAEGQATESKDRGAWPLVKLALLAAHLVAAWVLAWSQWQHPLGNWDIIPYTALLRSEAGMTPDQVSQRAYAEVRAYVGAAEYQDMLDGSGGPDSKYRIAVHADPRALADNLRFYSVKPLYLAVAKVLLPLTGNAASAAVLVSALAMGVVLSLVPLFFRQRPLLPIAAMWAMLFVGSPQLRLIASCAFPDALAMMLVVLAALTAVRRQHWAWTGGLALLAVLARPDAAVVLVPLLVGLAWVQRGGGRAKGLLGCAAAAFALFVVLGKLALPYSSLFWHTFMGREAFPSAITYKLTLADYLAVIRRTSHVLLEVRPLAFIVGGTLLALLPLVRTLRIEAFQVLAAAAVGNMFVHYLIFPIDEFGHERMFLGSYFLLMCAAALAWERWREPALGRTL